MRLVTPDQIDDLLTFPALVDALRQAFSQPSDLPERHHHPVGPGHDGPVHLLMPAWTANAPGPGSFLGTKIVNVFPENGRKGLPAVQGTYLLQSGETGEPLAVMDGTRLTVWRTAAASALAADYLAARDARHLLMVGAGALAPFLIRAHASVRPLDRITLWNRNRAGAERLAATLSDPRWSVAVADELPAAVADADIVSCATLSTTPLVEGRWLRPGTHLDLVGAFTLGMREADDEALRRGRVFVDTPAALSEGGDVAVALRSGAIEPGGVAGTLFGLCGGEVAGRDTQDGITVFKSVGTALEDLVAAMLVWRAAQAQGV